MNTMTRTVQVRPGIPNCPADEVHELLHLALDMHIHDDTSWWLEHIERVATALMRDVNTLDDVFHEYRYEIALRAWRHPAESSEQDLVAFATYLSEACAEKFARKEPSSYRFSFAYLMSDDKCVLSGFFWF